MLKSLEGSKTYIVCGAAILYAAFQEYTGQISWNEFVTAAQIALTGAGLRSGITTESAKS